MKLSGKNGGAPIATNSVNSEAPSTISGVAIGRKMNRFVLLRPTKSCRARASAMAVPSAVATNVDNRAIAMLIATALSSPATPNGSSHAASVNPCHTKLDLPAGSLKLNRIITATGAIR